ncbi:hypothetical protein C1646_764736 [Rhizophagus diaphanus]|nr:hypothetical protein C1646_764736 [Rhizophagus diaphanus] [Rhizophagus sp. MUCL 43196]
MNVRLSLMGHDRATITLSQSGDNNIYQILSADETEPVNEIKMYLENLRLKNAWSCSNNKKTGTWFQENMKNTAAHTYKYTEFSAHYTWNTSNYE